MELWMSIGLNALWPLLYVGVLMTFAKWRV